MRISVTTLKVEDAIDIARYALSVFVRTAENGDEFHAFLEYIERD